MQSSKFFITKEAQNQKLKNQIYILEKENQDLKNQLQFALSNNNLLESARKDLAQEKLSLMEEIQDLKHANSDLRRACDDEGMLEVKETLERRTKRLDNVWKDVECLHILMDKKKCCRCWKVLYFERFGGESQKFGQTINSPRYNHQEFGRCKIGFGSLRKTNEGRIREIEGYNQTR